MYEELSHYAPNRRCPPPPIGSKDALSRRGRYSVVQLMIEFKSHNKVIIIIKYCKRLIIYIVKSI